ncbi:peroxiredoxin [Geminocystis sp. GBBB08]|uniref:peroxiredoxin n=1 Tax=Geminocystis sp. GBBB08 TaxID=2604140 RepID=UPI0027E3AE79|nr:peroxiredoxin [Geminocystis sp. GBBB08]MBL1209911.1 peroxiredoxin [Geminocystis sp. GBBB08]
MFKYLGKIAIIFSIIFAISFNFLTPVLALGGLQPPLNKPAPEFTLPTNTGDGDISLRDYRGKWVVLYFYPQDFTPGCTIEAKRFQQDLPKYKAINTEIIGVSVDDVNSHQDFCDEEGLKFPLLADTEGKISKNYGSWLSGRSLRHTYIINPNGILVAQFLGVRPAIHSQEILATLEQLQKT